MVKGNKERRQELSALRREAKRDEGERRLAGPARATPVEARARLLSDVKLLGLGPNAEDYLTGWTTLNTENKLPARRKVGGRGGNARSNAPEIQLTCEQFFRYGVCDVRRCKFVHPAQNLGHLHRVPPPVGDGSEGILPLTPSPLRQCSVGSKEVYDHVIRRTVIIPSPLRFIEFNGELVFDADHSNVYSGYCKRSDAATAKNLRRLRQPWSAKMHEKFPRACRIAVFTTLLAAKRFSIKNGSVIPPSSCNSDDEHGDHGGDHSSEIRHRSMKAFHNSRSADSSEILLFRLSPELWEHIFSWLMWRDWQDS